MSDTGTSGKLAMAGAMPMTVMLDGTFGPQGGRGAAHTEPSGHQAEARLAQSLVLAGALLEFDSRRRWTPGTDADARRAPLAPAHPETDNQGGST